MLTLKRRNATILAAVLTAPVAGSNSLGYDEKLVSRTQLTLALIPANVADPTVATEAGIRWCTNIMFQEIGAWIAKVEQGTESDTYTLTGILARATTDQAAQAILANYQIFFEGSAVDALAVNPTSVWTLPSQT